jgi:hypothetical protein
MTSDLKAGTRYQHLDGRVCSWMSAHARWYHWDHEQPEPGPKERREYVCNRAHPDVDDHVPDNDRPCSCQRRGEHRLPDPGCLQHYPVRVSPNGDRGEFGMPGVGKLVTDVIDGIKELPAGVIITGDTELRLVTDQTDDKIRRVQGIIGEAMSLYSRKAAGYKGVEGDLADHLGVKGQFVDINRKFWRIKAMLWDEVVPMYPDAGMGEDVEEVLMDFIGHAALTIDFLRRSQAQETNGEGEA